MLLGPDGHVRAAPLQVWVRRGSRNRLVVGEHLTCNTYRIRCLGGWKNTSVGKSWSRGADGGEWCFSRLQPPRERNGPWQVAEHPALWGWTSREVEGFKARFKIQAIKHQFIKMVGVEILSARSFFLKPYKIPKYGFGICVYLHENHRQFLIWSNYSNLTCPGPPKGSLFGREILLFQGRQGLWNITPFGQNPCMVFLSTYMCHKNRPIFR